MRTHSIPAVASVIGLVASWCASAAVTPARDKPVTLHVEGGDIELELGDGHLEVTRDEVVQWVSNAARAVTTYYGRFPVSHYRIVIVPVPGATGVLSGTTWGVGGTHSEILVGEHATIAQLDRDWIMTHEMVHTAFPDQARTHHWIEEGIATYVEPLARSWVGAYSPSKVWTDLIAGVPRGLPANGDRGLDHTPTWGRTYWGGALFCLLADVEIRRRTHNQQGLVDALRGIVAAGGNDEVSWPITRALEVGDRAVGVPVLEEMYAKLKDEPVTPDLDALWKELGVSVVDGVLVLDDNARSSAIRRAISGAPDRRGVATSPR